MQLAPALLILFGAIIFLLTLLFHLDNNNVALMPRCNLTITS